MATRELESILERLGLSRYLEKCKEECIDDACLDHLEPDDVRELGFPIGPRRRFEAALAERSTTVDIALRDSVVAEEAPN